jgi:hypothetical protein
VKTISKQEVQQVSGGDDYGPFVMGEPLPVENPLIWIEAPFGRQP